MKIIIQRIRNIDLKIEGNSIFSFESGLLALVGISGNEVSSDLEWVSNKLLNLRVFNDIENKMNLSLKETNGSLAVVPNFTIYGDCKKGFRPSFINAGKPDESKLIFDSFIDILKSQNEIPIYSGIFGEDMKINFTNDGPVTLIIEK